MSHHLSRNADSKPLVKPMRSRTNFRWPAGLPLASALSGGLAWSPLGLFWLLPIFALAYGLAVSKRQQLLVIGGYYLGALWSIGGVFDGFWPKGAPLVGFAGWAGTAILIAMPWALAVFIGPDTSIMRSIRFLFSLLISALPPLGAYGLASPWIFVTAWFPGAGIAGLIMGAAWLSLLVIWSHGMRIAVTDADPDGLYLPPIRPAKARPHVTGGILAFGAVWAITANLTYLPPTPPPHWAVVNTDLSGFRGPVPASVWMHRQAHVAQIVRAAILSHPNHTLILFPESMAGPQFPNLFSTLMDNAMASMALEHDDTLLIGADDLANKQDDYTDSLNIMGRYQGRISARQPAPFGEWRPWGRHTALASWWHFGGYRIGKETIAWAICYEQMLVWPIAWNFLMDHHKPSVLLAPSDHDWARGVLEPAVQKQAIHAWARLYQIPVLYANDAPPASHPSRRNHLAKHG